MANDVELNDRRAVYIAAAGQTVFDIDFPILSEDDVAVFRNGIELDAADYVVDTDLLTVTLDTAAALNDSIVIEGDTAPVRTSSYPKSGALLSSVLNNDMRRFVYLAQELLTKVSRAVSLAQDESSGISQRLPKAETGKMLKWGAAGLENSTSDIDNIDDAVAAAEAAQSSAESASSAATTAKTQAQAAQAAAEAAAAGMKWRPSVKVATTANITLSGAQTIDGVAVVAGDRVLVKDQTTASQNGVYVVASGSWARATDADSWAELVSQVVAVEQGTANADYTFICTVDQGGTLGTTAVTWSTFKVIIPDGGVSTAAKIVDGILTYAKLETGSIATQVEALAGTSLKLIDAATLLAFMNARRFISSEQTVVAATGGSLAHGFGAVPYELSAYLVCKTTELGYAVGDRLMIPGDVRDAAPGSAQSRGVQVWADSTNVKWRIGADGIIILNASTGASSTFITAANWRLVIVAKV